MKVGKNQIVIFLLTVLLGAMIVFQIRAANSGFKYMSIRDVYANSIELEAQKAELLQLQEKSDLLKSEIAEYKTANEDERIDLEAFLKNEIERQKQISGITSVQGQGVIVIISDGTRELNENENPNSIMVHDLDVRAIVDDLRNAGAEAISINDQRVIFNLSEIECTGPTIKINDQVFAQPFIIRAIGDRKYLESAINAPGNYGETLRNWGVFIEVNTSINISIPGYTGEMAFDYIIN